MDPGRRRRRPKVCQPCTSLPRLWRSILACEPVKVTCTTRSVVRPSPTDTIEVDEDGARTIEPTPDRRIETTAGARPLQRHPRPRDALLQLPLRRRSDRRTGDLDCHKRLGPDATIVLLDDLKEARLQGATRAGLSFAKDDMRIPEPKRRSSPRPQKGGDRGG